MLCELYFTVFIIANSPANKAKWAEIRKREAEEHHH
jgi:hypothetical protein